MRRLLLALLLAVAAPAACRAETELQAPLRAYPVSLDPGRLQSLTQAYVVVDLFEALTRRAPDGALLPAAAKSWSHSEDGLTWRFQLRPEARWSDGQPVTAEDFVYAWRRNLVPQPSAGGIDRALDYIVGADAILQGRQAAHFGAVAEDALTLKIELIAPLDDLPDRLADPTLSPVPRHLVEAKGSGWALPGTLVGNGPYRLDSWQPPVRLSLTKSPSYWRRSAVRIDRVTFSIVEDASEQMKRLQTGELDYTNFVPFRRLTWIRSHMADQLVVTPQNGLTLLMVNVAAAPWTADPAARRALSLAIDRDLLANHALDGIYAPLSVFIPPDLAHYRSPGPPQWPASQEERNREAKRLWGLPGPRPRLIKLLALPNDIIRPMQQAIADMWKQTLGVDTDFESGNYQALLPRLANHDFTIAAIGLVGNVPDGLFGRFQPSGSIANPANYASPAMNTLLASAKIAPDSARRAALLAQAETILLSDAAAIPLLQTRSYHLVARRLRGLHPGANDLIYSADLAIAP